VGNGARVDVAGQMVEAKWKKPDAQVVVVLIVQIVKMTRSDAMQY